MAGHPKFSLRQQASVKDHIEAVKLVKFLQKYALMGRKGRVEAARVHAALGLLRKCIPDLKSTEHSGEVTVAQRLIIKRSDA